MSASAPTPPAELTAAPIPLSRLAAAHSLTLKGPDHEVIAFGTLTSRSSHRQRMVTYATSEEYLRQFFGSGIAACVVPGTLVQGVETEQSLLITTGDPEEAFYEIFSESVTRGRWEPFPRYRGANTRLDPGAHIAEEVVICDGAVVQPNATVLAHTYLGERVTVKAGAVIGGDGFQLALSGGQRRLVPHAGGVVVEADVTIGSQTCIDRGLFGEMTTIGSGSKIDNLVHVAHSARIGRDCVVVACAEISGSVVLGDGAWLGPSCSVNPGLSVGAFAQIGTGSVVIGDIPDHAVAFGSPARVRGWRCRCGRRLELEDDAASCAVCGRTYAATENGLECVGDAV